MPLSSDNTAHRTAGRCPLAVTIVNYRTGDLVIDCLESLAMDEDPFPGMRVVVADNASGDGSAEQIESVIEQRGWGDWVELVRSPVNGGFAAGNNVAVRAVEADRYLLLNSDALVRSGAIRTLMRVMDEHPDVGLLGPRIEWPDGTPQNTCYRFRTPITEMLAAARTGPLTRLFPNHVGTFPVPDHPMEPEWMSFACCLVRREVFERVGLLDEGYFLYFDDLDFCRRAHEAGWRLLHWPGARVVHLRGQSGPVKTLQAAGERRPSYYYASRNRYFAKFYGRAGVWMTNLLWEAGRLIALAREVIGLKEHHTCRREALDIWINALRPLNDSQWAVRRRRTGGRSTMQTGQKAVAADGSR